jgi:hypothetical protein
VPGKENVERGLEALLAHSLPPGSLFVGLATALSQPITRDHALPFAAASYDRFVEALPAALRGLLPRVFGGLCRTSDKKSVEDLFAKHVPLGAGGSALKSMQATLTDITRCAAFSSGS